MTKAPQGLVKAAVELLLQAEGKVCLLVGLGLEVLRSAKIALDEPLRRIVRRSAEKVSSSHRNRGIGIRVLPW